MLIAFLLMAGWIYYNTAALNTYQSSKQTELAQRDYELTYKHFEGIPQPRWVSFDYEIDIYPYERNLFVKADAQIVNKTEVAIDSLHFTLPFSVNAEDVNIQIDGASLVLNDSRLGYRIYLLDATMQPGDTLDVKVQSSIVTRGFENEVSFTSLTQNGIFFNNWDIMPSLGYNVRAEISSPTRCNRLGLHERQRMPRLDENDLVSRGNHYVSADSLGVQSSVPLNDYIDIGIFARPANGLRLGEPLHYERVHVTESENTFVRRVSAQPRDAGIDPYNYLIGRQPETNVRRVNTNFY